MNFTERLIDWYKHYKRDLPWRNTTNPYYIWLSEIILQQTRVNQGLPYYYKFTQNFPTIYILASADIDFVLKNWQGLGYYSRARNMHLTSQEVVNKYNGKFPTEYHELLKLKGIGPYTAAAISSFAFGLSFAVVDGNVIRVLSRVFGIDIAYDTTSGKNHFNAFAQELILNTNPAIYNQAIMDFGSIQCKFKNPECVICPMRDLCVAFNKGLVKDLPYKSKRINKKITYLHYFIVSNQNSVWMQKRTEKLWRGLYDFPFLEFAEKYSIKYIQNTKDWQDLFFGFDINIKSISKTIVHHLTHKKIYAKFWYIDSNDFINKDYVTIHKNRLINLPVSRLIEKSLNTNIH